jgi:hypothetical protein
LIKDVSVDTQRNWKKKHVETLRQYYAKAPFLEHYLHDIAEIIDRPWDLLSDLDMSLIDYFRQELQIETPIFRSSHLQVIGERNDRLLALCRYFGARRYLTGDAARSYLDVDAFEKEGIAVEWQNYQHPRYPQQHGAFVPYLSIVDMLFNVGPDCVKYFTKT